MHVLQGRMRDVVSSLGFNGKLLPETHLLERTASRERSCCCCTREAENARTDYLRDGFQCELVAKRDSESSLHLGAVGTELCCDPPTSQCR